jgi:hypothetical protein
MPVYPQVIYIGLGFLVKPFSLLPFLAYQTMMMMVVEKWKWKA